MNLLSNMDEIADLIIRPTRYTYKPVDLGPKIIALDGSPVHHHDFEVRNNRGLLLRASLYTRQESLQGIRDLIVYLHCNSGCRIEGLAYMKMAVAEGFSYVVFDFAGSGLSEGKYVSLGYYEVEDIKCILKHLRKRIGQHIRVVLWGRSMGAVAALRYLASCESQKHVLAAIFDSPFYSLKDLFIQIGRQRTNLPKIVLEVAVKYLRPIVQEKARFDMDQVHLSDVNKITNCPGIFIASKNDALIPFTQMDRIFKDFGGQKEMLFVEESHNEPRNSNFIKDVFCTMKKHFENSAVGESMFHSQVPSKDLSKKKLQLTIKSFSQKTLINTNRSSDTPRKGLKEINFPQMEKRQISCLFGKKKDKNAISQDIEDENSSVASTIVLKHHNQSKPKVFFKEENEPLLERANSIRFRSQKETGSSMIFRSQKEGANLVISCGRRDKERKTMQHMASKRPPVGEGAKLLEFRSSLEGRYRTQFLK